MLHIPLLPLLDRCQDICPSNIPSRHMYENGQGIGPSQTPTRQPARTYALATTRMYESSQDIGGCRASSFPTTAAARRAAAFGRARAWLSGQAMAAGRD